MRHFVAACLALALAGCASEQRVVTEPPAELAPPTNPIDIGVGTERPAPDSASVWYSSYSGFGARRRLVVRDAPTWATVWGQLTGSVMPKPEAPAVDFSAKMVLVATMGSNASGGYRIAIDRISVNGQDMLVVVREISPGRNCMVTAALTAPAIAFVVPAVSGSVSFREATETTIC